MVKNIVILGAGFGGLSAALRLHKKIKRRGLTGKYRVILIDKNSYHTYTPTLYEIATTSKEVAGYLDLKRIVTFPVAHIIRNTSIMFVCQKIEMLDLLEGDIHLADGEKIKYEYVVIALGSEANDFGIPGVREHALQLKSFTDALRIRDTVLEKLMDRGGDGLPVRCTQTGLRIVIGGGGSTGVELAGELKEWACALEETEANCNVSVSIVDGSPAMLSSFDQRVVDYATRRLNRLGVELVTGEFIKEVLPREIILKNGRTLPYQVFIWAGGVRAISLLTKLPLQAEARGRRLEVGSRLECLPSTPDLKLFGKIYALGDNICFYDPETKKAIPGVARAAISQAGVVAHNIFEDIKREEGLSDNPEHKKYNPTMEYPYVLPVGGKWAVAKIGPFVVHGYIAWILKGLIELYYLASIMPIKKALKIWLTGLRIFVQNDRLG